MLKLIVIEVAPLISVAFVTGFWCVVSNETSEVKVEAGKIVVVAVKRVEVTVGTVVRSKNEVTSASADVMIGPAALVVV